MKSSILFSIVKYKTFKLIKITLLRFYFMLKISIIISCGNIEIEKKREQKKKKYRR